MKSTIVSVSLLVVGLAVGFMIAKRGGFTLTPATNGTTYEVRYTDVGDALLGVQQNDTVQFKYHGSDLDVDFKDGVSPCVNTNPHLHNCQVKVARGIYPYECSGCPDPGIAVGSSAGALSIQKTLITGPYANPKAPRVTCKAGVAAVTPVQANPGESFEFYPVGEFDFSINMGNSCSQTSPLNSSNPTCTFQGSTPANFPMTVTNCGTANFSVTAH